MFIESAPDVKRPKFEFIVKLDFNFYFVLKYEPSQEPSKFLKLFDFWNLNYYIWFKI